MKSGCSRFFPGASKSAGADLALQSTQGQIALISRGRGTLVNCNIPGVRFGSPPAKLPAPSQGALKEDVGVFMESCTW